MGLAAGFRWRPRLAVLTLLTLGATVWLVAAGPDASAQVASAGSQQWAARQDGPANDGSRDDYPRSVATDAAGNVLVAGSTYADDHCCKGYRSDYETVKYDAAGRQLWSRVYDGPAGEYDSATALAVDGAGNAYVGVTLYGGSATYYDYGVIAYDAAGTQRWLRTYHGLANVASYEELTDLGVDPAGNVATTTTRRRRH